MIPMVTMPRNPGEAEWLVRSAEEEAARAARWAAVAQQHAHYQTALAKAHAADAAGLRTLWNLVAVPIPFTRAAESQRTASSAAVADVFEPVEPPKCEFCGEPTRIWNGRIQRFCSYSGENPRNCAQRFRDRRKGEAIRKARERTKATVTSTISCAEVSDKTDTDADPGCLSCGKPTRIWRGKPQKFCSPSKGQKVSPCATRYHGQARRSAPSQRAPRRRRGAKRAAPALPSGSVLATASSRAPGYALLASITEAIPRHLPEDLRSEIISEVALLSHEGMALSEAVAQATKSVRKNAAQLRYTKPIEDCFWLASEMPEGLGSIAAD